MKNMSQGCWSEVGAIARLKLGETLPGIPLLNSDRPWERGKGLSRKPWYLSRPHAATDEKATQHASNKDLYLKLYPCFAKPVLHRINSQLLYSPDRSGQTTWPFAAPIEPVSRKLWVKVTVVWTRRGLPIEAHSTRRSTL